MGAFISKKLTLELAFISKMLADSTKISEPYVECFDVLCMCVCRDSSDLECDSGQLPEFYLAPITKLIINYMAKSARNLYIIKVVSEPRLTSSPYV